MWIWLRNHDVFLLCPTIYDHVGAECQRVHTEAQRLSHSPRGRAGRATLLLGLWSGFGFARPRVRTLRSPGLPSRLLAPPPTAPPEDFQIKGAAAPLGDNPVACNLVFQVSFTKKGFRQKSLPPRNHTVFLGLRQPAGWEGG